MTSSPGGAHSAEPQRTTVHLLRHGEVHNPERLLYGRLPGYHLSELGRQMAEMAAEHLADHDVVHVVSSPLERAQETAAPVAAEHGLEVTLDDRVLEAENAFEGLPVAGGTGTAAPPAALAEDAQPVPPVLGRAVRRDRRPGCGTPSSTRGRSPAATRPSS